MACSKGLNFAQINLQHGKVATQNFGRHLNMGHTHISLIQEPYYWNNFHGLNRQAGEIFCDRRCKNPRTCIYVKKGVNASPLIDFCTRDLTAILFKQILNGIVKIMMCCSLYLPYDEGANPDLSTLDGLLSFCKLKGYPMVFGMDANSQHVMWGSSKTNTRGIFLSEFIMSRDLAILNNGNRPTFVNSIREQVIDLTLCSLDVLGDIGDWHVSSDVTCSDHRRIMFGLKGASMPPIRYRNPKNTDWLRYLERLEDFLGDWDRVIRNDVELNDAVNYINTSIISSYELSCPLKSERVITNTPWWCYELAEMKKDLRRKWNRRHRDRQAYNLALRDYKKACCQKERLSWKNFCERTVTESQTVRLQKTLARDPGRRISALKLPTGEFVTDEEDILLNLMNSHFPGCSVSNNVIRDTLCSSEQDWKVSKRIVSRDGIRWAIMSFKPYKSAGLDGIFPALLQFGINLLIRPLHSIFIASLALGFIPDAWQSVKVVFIPKPGKDSYEDPKSHRPICVSSVLVRSLEKLVDKNIKSTALVKNPLQANQHAYQKGKSTDSALHRLLDPIEKSVEQGEFALGAFVDILGAFDNTPYNVITRSLSELEVSPTEIRWMGQMLRRRILTSELNGACIKRIPTRGCPQGGVCSPLMWNAVANGLLMKLNSLHVLSVAYADDFPIIVRGKFINTVFDRMQSILNSVQLWCDSVGLSVNPDKTALILFTRKRKIGDVKTLRFYGKDLSLVHQVKHLGILLDSKLNWGPHLELRTKKACSILGQARRAIGCKWGLGPKQCLFIYNMIVKPYFLYGSVVWWRKTEQVSAKSMMSHLQRLACLSVTGALRSTPTAALELLIGLPPLHLAVQAQAKLTAYRLVATKEWHTDSNIGHAAIWSRLVSSNPIWNAPGEFMATTCITNRRFLVRFPTRDEWNDNLLSGEDFNFYTDGSLRGGLAGSGVFSESTDPSTTVSLRLGTDISVFQAEVLAISICAKYCLENDYSDRRINICSDSQAALKAVESWHFSSKLVLECRNALQELSRLNVVTLLWVPGHSNILGNEEADHLAREGSSSPFIGPWPSIPLSRMFFNNTIKKWLLKQHSLYWNRIGKYEQSRLYLREPLPRLTQEILKLSKKHARLVVGVLTGHCTLNKHLNRMGLATSSSCEKCGEEETAFHFMCDCFFYSRIRHEVFGYFVLTLCNYRGAKIADIIHFILKSGRFSDL